MSTQKQTHPVTCNRTGITVAAITVTKVAGHIPYLSHWKETQALHPIFSFGQTELLNFSKSLWTHFCSLTPEEAANPELTDKQETLLRVAALGMIHHLSDVNQTTVWLPSIQEVSSNWSSLLQLSYWKFNLDSRRFKFPDLRISKHNKAIDLGAYIEDCWIVKKEYESRKDALAEKDQIDSAERALLAIRNEIAGKAPKSKKLLWKWFVAHMPARYSKDLDSWMWELYDAETEAEISDFTLADIDLFEEIFLCEVPTGSSISHSFLQRLADKRKKLEIKFHTFEILVPDSIQEQVALGNISIDEPKKEDFASKVSYLIAHAKWKLAHTDMSKHLDAAKEQQATRTVKASYVPDITEYLAARDSETETDLDRGMIDGLATNDEITGLLED